jgi:hypothetical protein
MKIHDKASRLRLINVTWVCFFAQCALQNVCAQVSYRIEPVDISGMLVVTGGKITTDGTLGLLSASNILSMTVDISHRTVMGGPSGFEVLDGSTTLDLVNSDVSIQGLVEATSAGIRLVPAMDVGESNQLVITGDNGASVTWLSSHYDLDLGGALGGGHITGFHNATFVFAPPAGAIFGGLPESGLIARVVPEPSTIWLALIAIGAGCSRWRR